MQCMASSRFVRTYTWRFSTNDVQFLSCDCEGSPSKGLPSFVLPSLQRLLLWFVSLVIKSNWLWPFILLCDTAFSFVMLSSICCKLCGCVKAAQNWKSRVGKGHSNWRPNASSCVLCGKNVSSDIGRLIPLQKALTGKIKSGSFLRKAVVGGSIRWTYFQYYMWLVNGWK